MRLSGTTTTSRPSADDAVRETELPNTSDNTAKTERANPLFPDDFQCQFVPSVEPRDPSTEASPVAEYLWAPFPCAHDGCTSTHKDRKSGRCSIHRGGAISTDTTVSDDAEGFAVCIVRIRSFAANLCALVTLSPATAARWTKTKNFAALLLMTACMGMTESNEKVLLTMGGAAVLLCAACNLVCSLGSKGGNDNARAPADTSHLTPPLTSPLTPHHTHNAPRVTRHPPRPRTTHRAVHRAC